MVPGFNCHFSAFMSPAPAPSQSLLTSTIQEGRGRASWGRLPSWRTCWPTSGRFLPGPNATSPPALQVTHEEEEDTPRVPTPAWTGSQPGRFCSLVTSLHRPVCPTSQEPESLPGRRTYCSLRIVFVSTREETIASPKLFSPGSPFPCSGCRGCRGPSGLTKQGTEEGDLLESTHSVYPLSHVLLGAGTQGANMDLPEDPGVQGSCLGAQRGSDAVPPPMPSLTSACCHSSAAGERGQGSVRL